MSAGAGEVWAASDRAPNSITPATDDALRARVKDALGADDLWPVQREFFSQWVIENKLRGPQPDWASVGVTVTDNVAGFLMGFAWVLVALQVCRRAFPELRDAEV